LTSIRRAESEIQGLARKLNSLGEQMGDLEDLIRGKASAAEESLHRGSNAAVRRLGPGVLASRNAGIRRSIGSMVNQNMEALVLELPIVFSLPPTLFQLPKRQTLPLK